MTPLVNRSGAPEPTETNLLRLEDEVTKLTNLRGRLLLEVRKLYRLLAVLKDRKETAKDGLAVFSAQELERIKAIGAGTTAGGGDSRQRSHRSGDNSISPLTSNSFYGIINYD